MTEPKRRPSGMTRLSDVDCPACGGTSREVPGAVCATCGNRGVVSVAVATQFHIDAAKRANEGP